MARTLLGVLVGLTVIAAFAGAGGGHSVAPDGFDKSANAKACNDGIDNDGDGAVDYPTDPGCASNGDNSEADASPSPACSDGADNDNDGSTDYPSDPGCSSSTDTDESDPSQPRPVTFSGHLTAPEPSFYDTGVCANYGDLYSGATEGRTWHRFDFAASHDGWTFGFDVRGVVAEFTQTPGLGALTTSASESGTVPAGADGVWVCSRTAVNVDFVLTLTPPA